MADDGIEYIAAAASGGGGASDHGDLTGLADDDHPQYETSAEAASKVSTHAAVTTSVHGITDTSALATSSSVTSAVSTHAGLSDPHTGYVLESLLDAKGDLIAASANDTPAKVTAGANGTSLLADSGQSAGVRWGLSVAVQPARLRTGLFYPVPQGPVTTTVGTAGTLRAAPLLVANAVTLSSIAIEVTIIGSAGAVQRLGIWNDDGTFYPGTLLLDAGTVATDGTIGVKSISISQALTPGVWWVGAVPQTATATIRGVGSPTIAIGAETAALAGANSLCSYSMTGVTGALGTFSSTVAISLTAPRVIVGVA